MQKKSKKQIVSGYIRPYVPKIRDRYLSIKRERGREKRRNGEES